MFFLRVGSLKLKMVHGWMVKLQNSLNMYRGQLASHRESEQAYSPQTVLDKQSRSY